MPRTGFDAVAGSIPTPLRGRIEAPGEGGGSNGSPRGGRAPVGRPPLLGLELKAWIPPCQRRPSGPRRSDHSAGPSPLAILARWRSTPAGWTGPRARHDSRRWASSLPPPSRLAWAGPRAGGARLGTGPHRAGHRPDPTPSSWSLVDNRCARAGVPRSPGRRRGSGHAAAHELREAGRPTTQQPAEYVGISRDAIAAVMEKERVPPQPSHLGGTAFGSVGSTSRPPQWAWLTGRLWDELLLRRRPGCVCWSRRRMPRSGRGRSPGLRRCRLPAAQPPGTE